MSSNKALTDLEKGVTACFGNARRLVDDAELLFQNKRYISCFLLSELAQEEMAKGFLLLEKVQKKEILSRKEWEDFTRGAKAHRKKMMYVQQVYDKWLKKALRRQGISYEKYLEEDYDEYGLGVALLRELRQSDISMQATAYYHLRLETLYVQYDFEENQWTNPPKWVVANEPEFSLRVLFWAKQILSILKAELRGK